tara:strand:+ start:4159 stop:4611 length:453 start_codon:yes stop_codon:yes gene_type:complete
MNKKFNICICELFHPLLHGLTSNSSLNIQSHYLIHMEISIDDFWNKNYEGYLEDLLEYYYHNFGHNNRETIIYHPIIRNYQHILDNIDYLNIDIVEIIELPGNEQVACIKTVWLKILQRKWKKICRERNNKVLKLKNINNLLKREIVGNI